MKRYLFILILASVAVQVMGQIERLPSYKLVAVDSFDVDKDVQYLRTIKLAKDAITIAVDSRAYTFTAFQSTDSTFRSAYDLKYDLEISLWEIKDVGTDSVNLNIAYAKRDRKKGILKGRYFTIEGLKIPKSEIVGVYVKDQSKALKRKFSVIEIGLFTVITVGTIMFGSP